MASHLSYATAGAEEYVLAHGKDSAARRILIVPPLFDEMNRTRAMIVGAMRELGERGVFAMLPDLPGCNESGAAVEAQSVATWQVAMADCARELRATHVASIRGGALIAPAGLPHWSLAPAKGASLSRTLLRTRIAADKEAGRTSSAESLSAEALSKGSVELAGYRLGPDMLAGLDDAAPIDAVLTMQLGEAPGELYGKPIWLRAEPQEDPDMSAALAAELDRWSAA